MTQKNKTEIEISSARLTLEFQKCSALIKSLGSDIPSDRTEQESITTNIRRSLSEKLQKMTSDYKDMQERYSRIHRYPFRLNADKYPQDEESSEEENPNWNEAEPALAILDQNKKAAKRRQDQVKEIAKMMQDLKQLFMDLSEMVIIQGSLLDRIDQNIATASEHMERAVEELKEPAKSSNTTTKCWIGLLVLIVIIATAIIVVIRVRRG